MIILFVFAEIFIAVLGVVGAVRMLTDTSLTSGERVGHFCLSAAFFLVAWLLIVGGRAYVQDELNNFVVVEVGNE